MKKWFFISVLGLFFALIGCETPDFELQQHREEVVMRQIGHEILLQSNDSISLVLPIVSEENKYKIQFASDFEFFPKNLILIVDSVFKAANLKEGYLVQVEACETKDVVYSYEIDALKPLFLDEIACKERPQPKGCYEVIIQFVKTEKEGSNSILIFGVLLFLLVLIVVVIQKKKSKSLLNKNKIKIGEYLYDAKKMVLIRQEKTIELTSKESELLNLLYESVNETVSKEVLLNKVWGDEGDYIGRTLDVYISKLRKKLESDSSIQFKNIRGVGYKLIIER